MRAKCSLGCTATANLSVDKATARRLGLTKSKGSGRVVVARGRAGGAFKGRRRFSVRFTPSARTHLRGLRRLKVRLSATAIAGTTDRRTATSALTLSR